MYPYMPSLIYFIIHLNNGDIDALTKKMWVNQYPSPNYYLGTKSESIFDLLSGVVSDIGWDKLAGRRLVFYISQ